MTAAAALTLPAELTHADASACLGMLLQGVRAQRSSASDGSPPQDAVVVDANLLERFDSSAIAVLLECRRECVASGLGFSVRALPARLRELAGLYGVAQLLPAAA